MMMMRMIEIWIVLRDMNALLPPSHSPCQAGQGSISHLQWRNNGRPCQTPPASALSAVERPPETDVAAPGFDHDLGLVFLKTRAC